ncbi:MAG: protein O-GlcNAcase [Oligoflexia bacterium]|nr:protein O-GlcNAcase [Oligoflexia bacterium]
MRQPDLGIIEGFYGTPWSWEDRRVVLSRLARAGYGFYLYAPKGDPFLRKAWRQPYPKEQLALLRSLFEELHELGVEVGVGLSPYEIYRAFDEQARRDLLSRLRLLDSLGVDRLSILFDDMRGDWPGLARAQAEILRFVRENAQARRLTLCPTYYSKDPVLDRVFGTRPEGYLEELGEALDPSIGFYWTGDEICSTSYSTEGLDEVARVMRRKPELWDNYPVNDGQRMCRFLHLRAFAGRPPGLADHLRSHGVNPMNQAHLSILPCLTLAAKYAGKDASLEAALSELPVTLARALERDLALFQDRGWDALDRPALSRDYAKIDHPAAREIVSWLEGKTLVTRELVLTQ